MHPFVYDPVANTWGLGPTMARGRWYTTAIHTASNSVALFAGHPLISDASHWNQDVEFSSGTVAVPWSNTATLPQMQDYFPRAHVVGGNEIFISSPTMGTNRNVSLSMTVPMGFPDRGDATFAETIYNAIDGTSVLLPYQSVFPATTKGSVLRVGGVQPLFKDVDAPGWSATTARPAPPGGGTPKLRNNGHATILPTGDIFVSGGVSTRTDDGWDGSPDTSVRYSEVYRPDTNTWYLTPSAALSRNYHSTALLLPDGRVWTAGGNKHASFSKTGQASGEGRVLQFELFEPWYYGDPSRPVITSILKTGVRAWRLTTSTMTSSTTVVIVSPGSSTHAFDSDQRYIKGQVVIRTADYVEVQFDGAMLPSGWHMVFLLNPTTNPNGPVIPSIGAWIQAD